MMFLITNFKIIRYALVFVFFTTLISLSACSNEKETAKKLKLEKLHAKWNRDGKKWLDEELLILGAGEQHYLENCSICHSINGMGDIGKRSPILIGNPLVNEDADIPIKITLFGKRKMPRYDEKLSNEVIASILSYVRNAWSNTSGVLISEKDIQKYRHFNLAKLQEKWNWEGKTWQEKELRLLEYGENNYLINCAGCHLISGAGQTQIRAPMLKGNPLNDGDPEPQISIILTGIATMPAYANLLSDEIIASILSYEKNAWGTHSGILVKPEQVNSVRLKFKTGS